ncbi:MAG: flagellar hook-basal body complex protein FliE [Methanomassiliicoccaceae archaeon]|jgi:dephospho-CoA kinase|nr:flagellar hook-basal body complex protein FliE [Methanomassiliicoccaceae archaeon]
MRLIIVTGMPGTGKEEFLNVASDMGIRFIRMGDVVRETYQFRDAACKEMSVGEFAEYERKKHGYDIWAKRSLERTNGDVFLVDGCRSIDEVNAFRSLTDDVTLVAIHSTPETRYRRLVKRNRDDAPATLEEFIKRDEREMGWGIAKTIALADVMVPNDTTLEDFHAASKNVLERLIR